MENKRKIWPGIVACGAMYLVSLGAFAYLKNEILNDNINPYEKTISVDSGGGTYIQKNIIDVDKDGTPDITRTLMTYPSSANSLESECTTEEIKWFKEQNKTE